MTIEPSTHPISGRSSKRILASVVGVLVGVVWLALPIASMLFGMPASVPDFGLLFVGPVVVVVALAVFALARDISGRQERIAWFILAATGLWLVASAAFGKLVGMELDLVSRSESPDLVATGSWVALAVAVAAYVGLLVMGALMLRQLSVRSAADKT